MQQTHPKTVTRRRHLAWTAEMTALSLEFVTKSTSVANQARASAEASRIAETSPRNCGTRASLGRTLAYLYVDCGASGFDFEIQHYSRFSL